VILHLSTLRVMQRVQTALIYLDAVVQRAPSVLLVQLLLAQQSAPEGFVPTLQSGFEHRLFQQGGLTKKLLHPHQ
jgi:hypothetical protein